MSKKYPKIVYLQRDNNAQSDEEYLLAWTDKANAEDGSLAIYELKKVVKKRTEVIIEEN